MRTGRQRLPVTAAREAPATAADGARGTALRTQHPPRKHVEHPRGGNGTLDTTGPATVRSTHHAASEHDPARRAHERPVTGEGPAATHRGARFLQPRPAPEATHSTAGGRP
ncbi:hypothetical protein [Streptomyces sp. NPDC006997]|uniref:hypothetical protein n=1 Tax=Streptomyces sp. NPDC006997 TaxID=3155356 RepID=UPI0033D20977